MGAGIANGVASGALWGVVFLAPAVLAGFAPLQLAAARYLVYGLIAVLLLAPRWPALRASIGRGEWTALALENPFPDAACCLTWQQSDISPALSWLLDYLGDSETLNREWLRAPE